MIYEIIKPMKERVRFLVEYRNLFHVTIRDNPDQMTSETYTQNSSTNNSQQLLEKNNLSQNEMQLTVPLPNKYRDDDSVLTCSTHSDIRNEEEVISSKEDEDKENDVDDEESTFPNVYIIPNLPLKLQQIINKGEISEFRSHTNTRRLLLDAIFNDVTTKYSLL
jgi:hypothetical protein